jgi:hypothetical protein
MVTTTPPSHINTKTITKIVPLLESSSLPNERRIERIIHRISGPQKSP